MSDKIFPVKYSMNFNIQIPHDELHDYRFFMTQDFTYIFNKDNNYSEKPLKIAEKENLRSMFFSFFGEEQCFSL
jgi:hypothetical protein